MNKGTLETRGELESSKFNLELGRGGFDQTALCRVFLCFLELLRYFESILVFSCYFHK